MILNAYFKINKAIVYNSITILVVFLEECKQQFVNMYEDHSLGSSEEDKIVDTFFLSAPENGIDISCSS